MAASHYARACLGAPNIEFSCAAESAGHKLSLQEQPKASARQSRRQLNDYYDARQAEIFDSSCPPLFFVQTLSFFLYSSSSFHR